MAYEEPCSECGEEIRHSDARVGERHEWCVPTSDDEKAEAVIAHVRGKRVYNVRNVDIATADLVIGDRNNNSNKYDILKCRYLRAATDQMSQSSNVVPSNKELLKLLRALTDRHSALKVVWALPR